MSCMCPLVGEHSHFGEDCLKSVGALLTEGCMREHHIVFSIEAVLLIAMGVTCRGIPLGHHPLSTPPCQHPCHEQRLSAICDFFDVTHSSCSLIEYSVVLKLNLAMGSRVVAGNTTDISIRLLKPGNFLKVISHFWLCSCKPGTCLQVCENPLPFCPTAAQFWESCYCNPLVPTTIA